MIVNKMWRLLKLIYSNTILRVRLKYAKRNNLYIIKPALFNGKSIAIIGPADSALSQKKGKYIDSFDIVIRLNKSIKIKEEHNEFIGTKTLFLAHCMDESEVTGCGRIDTKLWKNKGVQKVLFLLNENRFTPNLDKFLLKNKARLPVYQIDRKDYQKIKKCLNGKVPTTGFAALFLLLNSNCSQLYISGFTFFKTGYQIGYRPLISDISEMQNLIHGNQNHDVDQEFNIIRDLIISSSLNLEIDQALSNLIHL